MAFDSGAYRGGHSTVAQGRAGGASVVALLARDRAAQNRIVSAGT